MTAMVPPAKGLLQLTWAQVEQLDAKIRSLCSYSEATGEEICLPLIIRNGKPIKIGQPMKLEKFRPERETAQLSPPETRAGARR